MIAKIHKYNYFCSESISEIENYDLALSDKDNTWDIHHRLETELNLSKKELIDNGLYYNRPASELIFLTRSEHVKLHYPQHKSHHFKHTEEAKRRIGLAASKRSGMKSSRIRKDIWRQKKNVLRLYKAGHSIREIAKSLGCSRTVVTNILTSSHCSPSR